MPYVNQMQYPIQGGVQVQPPIIIGGNYGSDHLSPTIKLLNDKEQDKNKEVVAVIVTFHTGGSYDHLFTSVEQKSLEGTRVLVYEASSHYINNLVKAFEGNP